MKLTIYRYDPDKDERPYLKDYDVKLEHADRMLLDALVKVKAQDDSFRVPALVPRRRLRVGRDEHQRPERPRLHHARRRVARACDAAAASRLPVIRDLIVDMTQFFQQYHSIKPYVINHDAPPERERLQSPEDREELNGLYECILCACCSTACPSFWWNPDKFVGPAGLLQAYRFLADTRDQATSERLDNLEDPYRLFRCHTIMNCVDVCPKGLNPTKRLAGSRS
jgi:succinate dehydrogenase / fumarate reductase iron-sulfur subunit